MALCDDPCGGLKAKARHGAGLCLCVDYIKGLGLPGFRKSWVGVLAVAVIPAVASIVVGGRRGWKYVGDCVGDIVHVVGDGSGKVTSAGNCTEGEDTRKQSVFDQVLSRLIA